MGEKGCESCREWQEHCYREHMDVSRIRFFRLMTGDFAHGIVSIFSSGFCHFGAAKILWSW